LLVSRFGHETAQSTECNRSDRGEEKKIGIVAEAMNDATGGHLAERSTDADRRRDGAEGQIRAA
jgi:hypothetical protein